MTVYIVATTRTPFIKMAGGPNPFSASDLAVEAIKPLWNQYPDWQDKIDQVIAGCVAPDATEMNIARLIALRTGCPESVPAYTVHRNCASGLQAIDSARLQILSGQADLVLAGGTEAMSRTPLLLSAELTSWLSDWKKKKNWIKRFQHLKKCRPRMLRITPALLKGLHDPFCHLSMGQTAEEMAYQFNISREDMDAFSLQSHAKARAAQAGSIKNQITPLFYPDGHMLQHDDGVRTADQLKKLTRLKPVFDTQYGNITAGNSSQISDGAAFVVLASEKAVSMYGLPVLGILKDVFWAGLSPSVMGLGPVHAMNPLLARHHLSYDQLKSIEINEAFSAQVLGCLSALSDEQYLIKHHLPKVGTIELDTLNPEGGAIAIGHPVGASGARLVMDTCHRLMDTEDYGVLSLCIGGGQGGAALIQGVKG